MERNSTEPVKYRQRAIYRNTGNGIYGLGFLGTFIYYIVHATSFWMGLAGFFKAVFWPAFLVYYLLDFMKI